MQREFNDLLEEVKRLDGLVSELGNTEAIAATRSKLEEIRSSISEFVEKTHIQSVSDVNQIKSELEYHAFSVRQLILQRKRLFKIFEIASQSLRQTDAGHVADVLSSIESTDTQFYQDIFCLLLSGGKRNGYFVEFGACDGLAINNTILLEQRFGWKGILAEPATTWHEALFKNRTAIIDTRCVWSKSNEVLSFTETEDALESSVILEDEQQSRASYSVNTISLEDLLLEHKAPSVIDYLSMDVEGSEAVILESFPFSKYRFEFVSLEHRAESEEAHLVQLMAQNGYRQVLREFSGGDGFYVPEDKAAKLNLK
ncbi:FkbM family methyltransferase [Agrobacterium fabrum]|uniref:Methyltransferase, FkbM family n=1 Tax=Agrobacterium fabrum TaxID=1176649 RepID=A0A7Z7BPJ3_9HYPH|nr:FkbM family methyltransferase [Agrobacterium fabrum]WIE29195.1 FkbM family methyltransferase [Agrobacterium fabrum]WIE45155.1 FkbM family methyltransferase [Agrobacterium fabrum]SDJ97385.1 methyltransferase, FkbM family [Agrobacterium fabrum]